MNLRTSVCLFCTVLITASAVADNKKPKPKQEAKDYYEQASKETDPVKKIQLACQASQLEPKDKKYSEECSKAQAALSQQDNANLQSAKDAYQARQFDKAEASARAVTSSNEKLHSQAQELIGQIQNTKYLALVQSAWVKGDFETVKAYSVKITDPNGQAAAKKIVDYMDLYNTYVTRARVAENDNPEEALRQYTGAFGINPHGPVDAQAKITEMKAKMVAKAQAYKPPPPPSGGTPPPVVKQPGDNNTGSLLKTAKEAEKSGNLQDALVAYQGVIAVDPANFAAKTAIARLQPQVQAAADRVSIKKAIGDFYQNKLDTAQQELNAYLKSATPPLSPGVAYFYLGASILEQSLLNTPQAQWQGTPADAQAAFKEARKANFTPMAKYVSPALMKAWESSAQ
jgi:hypothetical protein